MILLVDIGNTRLKWASLSDRVLHGRGAIAYRAPGAGGLSGELLDAIWRDLPEPARIVVCSVAGASTRAAVAGWARERWGVCIEAARSLPQGFGVTNGYRDPTQLGDDRWAAMVGARQRYLEPVCIVDCGTAVTVDVLDAQGRHLGGLILPGLWLMRDALRRGTSQIDVAEDVVRLELARDTGAAVGAGAAYAICSTVERVLRDVERDLNRPPRCVLTGGDAARLIGGLRYDCDLEEDLVLQGLAIIVTER